MLYECETRAASSRGSEDLRTRDQTCPLTLSCSSLSMKATGQPWRFPDGEVMGVLISAWASTQIRHRSGHCWAWPPTDPMPRLEGGGEDGDVSVGHSRKDPAHLRHHFLSPCSYLWSPPSMTSVWPAPIALLVAPASILLAAPTLRGKFTPMNWSSFSMWRKLRSPKSWTE